MIILGSYSLNTCESSEANHMEVILEYYGDSTDDRIQKDVLQCCDRLVHARACKSS